MSSEPEIHPCQSWRRPVAWALLVIFMTQPVILAAQDLGQDDARLQPGDTLELSVPGRDDLSMELTVDPEGAVNLPRVGDVNIAGLTVEEASLVLKNKLRLFHPTLDTVHLEMTRSGALKVYVIGKVDRPGLLTFSGVPSLWEVLRAAGGVSEQGDLRSARVIREEGGIPQVTMVDLSGIMDGKTVPDFKLKDGDTLIIPALLEGISAVPAADGVKVFGGVGVPTIVPITDPMPMLDVLMLAGAPSDQADKKRIHWVHEDGGRAHSTLVNLELYLKEGNPVGNPLVYPGDTLNVSYAKASWKQNLTYLLVSLASVMTILLGYDRLVNE